MWTAQTLNALADEVRLTRRLYDTVFELKAARARIEALGVLAVPADVYPPPGELDHLTRPKVAGLLAAMDVLDAALLTPAPLAGVTRPPIVALVDAIR